MSSDNRIAALDAVTGGVSRETAEGLITLQAHFLRWASTINLVSANTLPHIWERHVLDSAQLWRYRGNAGAWLDLGSGSGFPGLVLAVLAREHKQSVTLVESNAKKSAYLRDAARHLSAPVQVRTQRVEVLPSPVWEVPDLVVTARAFAPLSRIFEWTNGFGRGTARALLHKGRGYMQEVREARDGWTFDLLEHPSAADPEGMILEITNVRPA